MTVVVIGEVLVDRFPEGDRPGGAPFNVACHLKGLGVPVRLITRVGDDDAGQGFKQMLARRGFDPGDIQTDADHPTGLVDVALDDAGVPTFSIRENVAYDYLAFDHLPRTAFWDRTRFVYFGSLIQRTAQSLARLQRLLSRLPDSAAGFCDINLRPPHVNGASVAQCLKFADVLKLSEEELGEIRRITGHTAPSDDAAAEFMASHGIATMALTRGADGSTIIHDGVRRDVSPLPAEPIADTVGAGDGYAAILLAGLVRGLPMAEVGEVAGRFAAAICRIHGAVPDDAAFYDDWKPYLERRHD
jgi:fructokinase